MKANKIKSKVKKHLREYMEKNNIFDKIDDTIIDIYASNVATMAEMDEKIATMDIVQKETLEIIRAKNTLAGTNLRVAKMIGITEYSRKGLNKVEVSEDDDDFKDFN